MAKIDFLERSDEGFETQLDNFCNKIDGYAATLGVGAAQIVSIKDDRNMFKYLMLMREAYKTKTQDVTRYKNILRKGPTGTPLGVVPFPPVFAASPAVVASNIEDRFRKLVAFIKAATNYNDAIGEDLGIIGDENEVDPSTLKPILIGALDAGRPLIKWTKATATSIDIYVERVAGSGFSFLANDSQPDYIDTFPIPDGVTSVVWKYKAIYKIGDEQVGMWSEAISITVTREVV